MSKLLPAAVAILLVGLAALGDLTDLTVGAVLVLALAASVAYLAVRPQRQLSGNRVRYQRVRLWLRLHPGRGHATAIELFWRWGRFASFRQSGRVRPSAPFLRLLLHPDEHSIYLGCAQYLHKLRVGLQENILILAPPRVGKSGYLARAVLHAPGPVVSATTRSDIFALTSGIRSRYGSIHVFNPQGIGNVPSTFRWNPLEGCQDEATAIRRADSFAFSVSLSGTEDSNWWASKASDGLRALLLAGAIAETDFRLVARWIMSGRFEDAAEILATAGHHQFAASLNELMGPAEKTAATVRMVMSRAIAFMTDPQLAASVLPAPGASLDIDAFASGKNTLYLIGEGAGAESPLASLFVALTSEIQWRAVQLGSQMPGGRLDPPMLLALDEVTQIVPVPLPAWMADGSGKGIPVIVVAHGQAQLESRWGKAGARSIMDTAGCKLLLGGISDPDTLTMAEKLSGQVAIQEHGKDAYARHPVVSAEMVRELPPGFGLLLRGALAPAIVKLPMAWKDRTYRRARRAGQAVARLRPAPIPGQPASVTAIADREEPELRGLRPRSDQLVPDEPRPEWW